MKKILLWSALSAFIIGVLSVFYFSFTPSKFIISYDVDAENKLYTISEYNFGTFLKASDSNGNQATRLANYLDGETIKYISVQYFDNKLYVAGSTGGYCYVDRYSTDCSFEERVFSYKVEDKRRYVSIDIVSAFNMDENVVLKSVNNIYAIVIIDETEIVTECIASTDAFTSDSRRYILDDSSAVWACYINKHLIYQTSDGQIFYLDKNSKPQKFDIDGNAVIYKPYNLNYYVCYTDLNDISYKAFYPFFNPETQDFEDIYYDDYANISAETVLSGGYKFKELRDVKALNYDEVSKLAGLVKEENSFGAVVIYDVYDGTNSVINESNFPLSTALIWGLFIFAGSFALLFIILLIVRGLLSVRKLVVKQTLISILIIVLFFYPIKILSWSFISTLVNAEISSSLTDMLNYLNKEIDKDEFAENGLTEKQCNVFRNFENRSISVTSNWSDMTQFDFNNELSIDFIEVARLADDGYRYEYYSQITSGAKVSYFLDDEHIEKLNTLGENQVAITNSYSYHVHWYEASIPITDNNGKMIGFIQVGSTYNAISDVIEAVSTTMAVFFDVLVLFTALILVLSLTKLLKPLKKLKAAVSEISEGKIGTTISIKTNDELQDISYSFSEMSLKLNKYFNSINVISKAYERYLSKDFFTIMDKKNVLDVKPFDKKEVILSYLFIGINKKGLNSENNDNFAMLNSIYSIVSDEASAKDGVIQNFDETRITVIFSQPVSSAIETAFAIQEKLSVQNMLNADIIISIQYANSTIGVIGNENGMRCIAVSSAMDLQKCVMSIMQKFKLTYIITEDSYQNLNNSLNITCRYIGKVSELCGDESNSFDIRLYEVIEGCKDEEKTLKMSSLSSFNEAVSAFESKNYKTARSCLINVLRINRSDFVAREYLAKIENIFAEDASETKGTTE